MASVKVSILCTCRAYCLASSTLTAWTRDNVQPAAKFDSEYDAAALTEEGNKIHTLYATPIAAMVGPLIINELCVYG